VHVDGGGHAGHELITSRRRSNPARSTAARSDDEHSLFHVDTFISLLLLLLLIKAL
jgi:hypothetical protein